MNNPTIERMKGGELTFGKKRALSKRCNANFVEDGDQKRGGSERRGTRVMERVHFNLPDERRQGSKGGGDFLKKVNQS